MLSTMRGLLKILCSNSPSYLAEMLVSSLRVKLGPNLGRLVANQFDVQPPAALVTNMKSKVFGEFVAESGQAFSLYDGYRDRIKSQWRLDYWPTIALLNSRSRIDVGSAGEALVSAIYAGRTLPASLDEIADVVAGIADTHPHELIQSEIPSPLTRRPVIAARVTDKQADSFARYYRQNASGILREYARYTPILNLAGMRTLEVGCGMGYGVMAMSSFGVAGAVGIDVVEKDYRWISERPSVIRRLGADKSGSCPRAEVLKGDCMRMEFEDNRFDLIHSASVVEHIPNLERAFVEMTRVLKPGGLMIHNVDPYFSPKGGHASCTLDFPWGHAVLTPQDFSRYLQQWRPYERDHALGMYEKGFNLPRVSLFDIERLMAKAGLAVLSWREKWANDHLPSAGVWRDINALHSAVGMRDLSVMSLNVVLMKQ